MKPLMIGVAAALLLGAGGYLLVGSSTGAEPDETQSRSPKRSGGGKHGASSARAGDSGSQDLEQRVAQLEREVKQLRMQSRVQTRQPSSRSGAADEALSLDNPQASAVIHEVVQDAFQDAKQEEREMRTQRQSERMNERREESLAALVAAAALGVDAQQKIGQIWQGEQDQMAPLIEKARDGALSRREVREQIDAIRTQTDQAAYELLDEGQRAAYDENRPGPRGGGGGPRGGGGPGGGR